MSTLRELERLQRLARTALSTDPGAALAACRSLEQDEIPWLRERALINARRAGWAWRPIGRLPGISHQAAATRYRRSEQRIAPTVQRPLEWGTAQDRLITRHLCDLRLQEELASWERSGIDIVPW